MLSKELEVTLNLAFKEARTKRHEFMTVEHLLLALLDNDAAVEVLDACGADNAALRKELQDFVDATTPLIPASERDRETQPTLGFQRVLQRAVFHVQSSGKSEVTGANVLVAIFSESESQAVFFLKQQQIQRIDVVNFISHGISKLSDNEETLDNAADNGSQADEENDAKADKGPLETYATNLNQEVRDGKIDPLIGRDFEVQRVIQTLSRRRKNNPAGRRSGRR